MALDEISGDLVFGWFDGRNDKTLKTTQYFAAAIPAAKLDELVRCLPISNPTYSILPTNPQQTQAIATGNLDDKQIEEIFTKWRESK